MNDLNGMAKIGYKYLDYIFFLDLNLRYAFCYGMRRRTGLSLYLPDGLRATRKPRLKPRSSGAPQ